MMMAAATADHEVGQMVFLARQLPRNQRITGALVGPGSHGASGGALDWNNTSPAQRERLP